jgi:hypothetical protein
MARDISFQPEKVPSFFWMQGVEDMVIWVMLPEGTTKKDLKVNKQSTMVFFIGCRL